IGTLHAASMSPSRIASPVTEAISTRTGDPSMTDAIEVRRRAWVTCARVESRDIGTANWSGLSQFGRFRNDARAARVNPFRRLVVCIWYRWAMGDGVLLNQDDAFSQEDCRCYRQGEQSPPEVRRLVDRRVGVDA